MKYVIQKLEIEGDNKLVGFEVEHEDNRLFIDKRVALVEGKADEVYITEALALAKPEIDEWVASFENIGREWDGNAASGSFV